jgi:hypothetical protein
MNSPDNGSERIKEHHRLELIALLKGSHWILWLSERKTWIEAFVMAKDARKAPVLVDVTARVKDLVGDAEYYEFNWETKRMAPAEFVALIQDALKIAEVIRWRCF